MRRFVYISLVAWVVCFLSIFLILLYGAGERLWFSAFIAFELSTLVFGVIFIFTIIAYLYIRAVYRRSSNPLVKKSVETRVLSKDKILGVKASSIVLILMWKCILNKRELLSVVFLCKNDKGKLLKICKKIRIRREQFDRLIEHIHKLNRETENVDIVVKELHNSDLCNVERVAYRMLVVPSLLGILILAFGISFPTFPLWTSIVLSFIVIFPTSVLIELWEFHKIVSLINQTAFPKSKN